MSKFNKGEWELCRPLPIIAITGKARSGKGTMADVLIEEHDFIKMSFADPLKEGCAKMFGCEIEEMYEGDREKPMYEFDFSIRQLLQHIGTEGVRALDVDAWVKLFHRRMYYAALDDNIKGVVVDDCRFQNEVDYIHDMGGTVIQVHREDNDPVGIAGHSSEGGIHPASVDYQIINNGTLEGYLQAIDRQVPQFI